VSDDPRAAALRERAAAFVIPIMDVDSVQQGAGGKWQDPHDHNRDWSDKPHWRAVQAAMLQCQRLDVERLFGSTRSPDRTFEFWCNCTGNGGIRYGADRPVSRACKAEIKYLAVDDRFTRPTSTRPRPATGRPEDP
jgi:hypothetical protein